MAGDRDQPDKDWQSRLERRNAKNFRLVEKWALPFAIVTGVTALLAVVLYLVQGN